MGRSAGSAQRSQHYQSIREACGNSCTAGQRTLAAECNLLREHVHKAGTSSTPDSVVTTAICRLPILSTVKMLRHIQRQTRFEGDYIR